MGLAVTLLIAVAVVGWLFRPIPPFAEARAYQDRVAAGLEEPEGLFRVTVTPEGIWHYHMPLVYYIIPVPARWSREYSYVARSAEDPSFTARGTATFGTGDSSGLGGQGESLQDVTQWADDLRELPATRRSAFYRWWARESSAFPSMSPAFFHPPSAADLATISSEHALDGSPLYILGVQLPDDSEPWALVLLKWDETSAEFVTIEVSYRE